MNNNNNYRILKLYKEVTECYEQLALVCYQHANSIIEPTKSQLLQICLKKIENLIDIEAQNIEDDSFECTTALYILQNKLLEYKKPKMIVMTNKSNEDYQKIEDIVKNAQVTARVNGLEDVAGLADVKKVLKTKIMLPILQPQLFTYQKVCNSILLYGPPGTGKTRIVHAIAAEASAQLYSVACSDIMSKYVGETEKIIRCVFETVKSSQCNHTILFIDEVDGLCRKRTTNEEEWIRRLKTELLSQISNFEDQPNVFLICATNCPWDLDPAFFRRFQERIYIPLPNRSDRFELLTLFTKKTALESTSNSWGALLNSTEGYSGCDIANLVFHAINIPIMELTTNQKWYIIDDKYMPANINDTAADVICCDIWKLPPQCVEARTLQFTDLLSAVNTIKKTVSDTYLIKYKQFIDEF